MIQVYESNIATSEERVEDWQILVNQWRNEHSLRDELRHHLVFTKNDTAGEVIFRENYPADTLPLQVHAALALCLFLTSPAVSKLPMTQNVLAMFVPRGGRHSRLQISSNR